MAAMTNDIPGLEPERGLWPVSEQPEDPEKDEFARIVWEVLTPDAFDTIASFEEWFNKTLVPETIESLGGPQVGRMMIHLTFKHGGAAHFMRWVLMKFTTTTSPQEAAAAAAEAAAEDARTAKLMKEKAMVYPAILPRVRTITAAEPAAKFEGPHDQDDLCRRALEDRCIFIKAPASEPAAAAPSPKPSGLAAMMDDENRAMLEVMQKEGPQAAMNAMMDAAGGDYAEMRMMYG